MNKNKDIEKTIFKKPLLQGYLQVRELLSLCLIPVGPTRCFPFQHSINVIAGVLLGPFWAVGAAFTTSLIRNMMGTGAFSLFPEACSGHFLWVWRESTCMGGISFFSCRRTCRDRDHRCMGQRSYGGSSDRSICELCFLRFLFPHKQPAGCGNRRSTVLIPLKRGPDQAV